VEVDCGIPIRNGVAPAPGGELAGMQPENLKGDGCQALILAVSEKKSHNLLKKYLRQFSDCPTAGISSCLK